MTTDAPLDAIKTALWAVQATRYSELASSSIILFDHLMTLDKEIELIWQSPWSPGKVLFIINRYHGLAILVFNNYAIFGAPLTDSFCLSWFRWQGCVGVIMCMTAEVILQLRLFALYYLSKRVLVFVVFFFVLASAAAATMMGTVLAGITARAFNIAGFSFCAAGNTTHHFYAFWIPILVYETILCVLAMLRGIQNYRETSSVYLSGKRIFAILVRDSILYFLVMFATYFVNFILFLKEPIALIEVPIGFSVALSCVMGNRLLLNIRETARETDLSGAHKSANESSISYQNASSQQLWNVEMSNLRTSMRAEGNDNHV